MARLYFLIFAVICLMVPAVLCAQGFGINATRLIYHQDADSISVTMRNTMTNQPYLVQVRVSRSQDSNAPAPFVVRPPLFRLEPGSVNQVRILAQNANLPDDRESIFYLHANAIPASTAPMRNNQQASVNGTAQFGVGNIIKLFYRPTGLPSSSAEAQRGLQFTRVDGGLKVTNSSPYFVSLATLQVGGRALKLDTPEALMLAPFGSHTYPVANSVGSVRWQTINDEGDVDAFEQPLP